MKKNNIKVYLYYCPDCDTPWDEVWSSACDSDCPRCGKTYTPFDTEKEWNEARTPNSIRFITSMRGNNPKK